MLILENIGGGSTSLYVAFTPTQIKSAISHTGEFSDSNPDIVRSALFTSDSRGGLFEGHTATKDLNKRGFEKDESRKEITKELESLGVGASGGLQARSLRNDLASKDEKGRNNKKRPSLESRAAEKLTNPPSLA